jgi:hypothetical protein
MADDELLRLDYAQTASLLRELAEVRFKLLAFVPTVAGTAVAFLRNPGSAGELLGVGLVGLAATIGIYVYELRNSQLYSNALDRAVALEGRLGMISVAGSTGPGGPFTERPPADRRLAGFFGLTRGTGLATVYGAAIGGWAYLVAWGLLRLADASHARGFGAAVGIVIAFATVAEAQRVLAKPPSETSTTRPAATDPA